MPERDSATSQVVRRKLNHHPVARQYTNVILPHSTAEVTEHLVAILEFDLEHRVRKRLENLPFNRDRIRIGPARPLRRRRGRRRRGRSRWWFPLL